MEKDIYLYFGGWAKLNTNTRMQYIGQDDNVPQFITVKEFIFLPLEERQDYILEDFVAAIRDAEDIECSEITVETNE
jgi:hypothetical protein